MHAEEVGGYKKWVAKSGGGDVAGKKPTKMRGGSNSQQKRRGRGGATNPSLKGGV